MTSKRGRLAALMARFGKSDGADEALARMQARASRGLGRRARLTRDVVAYLPRDRGHATPITLAEGEVVVVRAQTAARVYHIAGTGEHAGAQAIVIGGALHIIE